MVRRERDGAVSVLTLERPDRRNALRRSDLTALRAAVEDTDAPVISLEGDGPAFCAGADLDVVGGLDHESAREFAALGQDVARAIETADPVVVAPRRGPRSPRPASDTACSVRGAAPSGCRESSARGAPRT